MQADGATKLLRVNNTFILNYSNNLIGDSGKIPLHVCIILALRFSGTFTPLTLCTGQLAIHLPKNLANFKM